jgi:uncharacterized membrane protein
MSMANKNQNVIIAYFPSADKADMAANQLKEWDQRYEDVKLGGIAIMAWDGEKIETHTVGARASGTGAKVGTTLGVIAAVLSGGVTLVGGVAVGAIGGALFGSLKRKGTKLSEQDIATITQELKSGKAALVVMADDNEVKPTQNQLVGLGGTVTGFAVPAEAMTEVEKAADAAAGTAAGAADAAAGAAKAATDAASDVAGSVKGDTAPSA